MSFSQSPSGCGSTNWPNYVSTTSGSSFTVPAGSGTGWTYVWVVSPSLTILSGQGTTTAVIKGVSGTSGQVCITRYKNGVNACADCKTVTVGTTTCDINQNGTYQLNVTGSENVKFYTMPSIQSGGVNSFSYLWTFTYQDGTTSTSNVREPYIPIYCSNPVIQTTVLITSTICSKTITKVWSPGVCGTSGQLRISNNIKVSPNPTNSIINFDGIDLSIYNISIFDRNGIEIIKNSKINQPLSLDKFEKGIYLYIITNDLGYKQDGKIIKE